MRWKRSTSTCAEKSQLVRRSPPRDGNTFQKVTSGDVGSSPESFRHDDPGMEGLYTSGNTTSTGKRIDLHALQHGYSVLCLDAENAYFHADEDEEVYCWPPKEWVKGYHAGSGRVLNPWLKLQKQLYGRRKAAKKFNEFVVTATVDLGLEQCLEQPSLFRRPGTTLVFESHQDDFYLSDNDVELGWPPGTSRRTTLTENQF